MNHSLSSSNVDVLTEILLRQPVKSLLRFKTVQKSWNNIISSPIFTKLYTKSSQEKMNHELNLEANFLQKISDDSGELCSPKVAGPVKDLICIYGVYSTQRIALYDLSTSQFEILPEFPTSERYTSGIIIRSVGFGINDMNEFMVVQLLSYVDSKESNPNHSAPDVRLYFGNEEKCWKRSDENPGDIFIKKAMSPCKNGYFCHWLAVTRSYYQPGFMFLLSYDFTKYKFRRTLLPTPFNDAALLDRKQEKIKIFVEGNSLFLFSYPILGGTFLERWVLNGFGGRGLEWTKLPPIGPLLQLSKPVALRGNLGVFLKYHPEGKYLAFYDCSTQEIRFIEIPQKKKDRVKVIEYKDILVSIGM